MCGPGILSQMDPIMAAFTRSRLSRRTFALAGSASLASSIIAESALAQPEAPAPVPMPRSAVGASGINTSELAPGEFLWEPDIAPDGPVVIIVSLPDQLVHVYRNGIQIGVSTCSTGKPGHGTPTGVFIILQKDKHHRSSTYNNAPMPNMQRLTWRGIALHAGNLPGYPASHGCVRLPKKFSELIFGITHLGIPVIIADAKSQPGQVVHPGLLLPSEAEIQASEAKMAAAEKSHHPAHATTDTHSVASVLVSGADRTITVMENGIVLWESAIELENPVSPLGNRTYTLLGVAQDRRSFDWMIHGLHGDQAVNSATDETLHRIHIVNWQEAIPLFFRLVPGTSMVVTDLPAGADTRTQPDFVIIREEGEIL